MTYLTAGAICLGVAAEAAADDEPPPPPVAGPTTPPTAPARPSGASGAAGSSTAPAGSGDARKSDDKAKADAAATPTPPAAASTPATSPPSPGATPPAPAKDGATSGSRCPPWVCKDGSSQPTAPASAGGDQKGSAAPVPPPTAKVATAASAAPAAAPAKAKRQDRDQRRFIEGELANVGATGLTPWQNRFGIVMGPELLGPIYYGVIRPEINYTREIADKELSLSFQVPIRLQLLDTRPQDDRFAGIGQIRKQDWDEPSDFARVISYISYGGKEEHVYLDINQFKASSIGHGTVIKRYNPNLNFNSRRVSFEFDAFGDYGGVETYLNDVTGPNVMGALAFVKPLSFINRKNYFLRSFSIGATVAADIDAPLRNLVDSDDADDDGKRDTELSINQKTFQPNYVATEVVSYGSSVEAKFVDTDAVDWKSYIDLSFLESGVPTDDPTKPTLSNIPTRAVRSSGLSWGHLLRLNFDRRGPTLDPRHALRFRVELRQFDPNYLPSYFDTLYEVQRVQYVAGKTANSVDLANRTKLQSVLGRDASGPKAKGFFFEASWKAADWFAFAVALEMNDRTPDNNWFVHFEVPNFYGIQFLATYHRRTARDLNELFSVGFGNNDVLVVKGRYRISNALAVNAEAFTPFGIGPDSLFRNTLQFNVNAEIGFNYGQGKK